MARKYVTNADIERELGEIQSELKHLRQDMSEIKALYKRVKDLELFKSYVLGISAAIGVTAATTISIWKVF